MNRAKRNPKRKTRNKSVSYNESSPEPRPHLQYRKPRKQIKSIKSIALPSLLDDGLYWVKVDYWFSTDIEYYPMREACIKFNGNADKQHQSLKEWILSFEGTQWMTPHLLHEFEAAITVTVTPKYPVGAVCMLVNEQLPSLISYVTILAINCKNYCHFDQTDDLLLYLTQHIDLRSNKILKFNKTSGKEFNLVRPKGWVTECSLLLIILLKYIGMPDVVWMQAQLHYYRLLSEANGHESETLRDIFCATIKVLFEFIGIRTRGTLHRRNEGKIKSFTFGCAPQIIDCVLNSKFREIKKLKNNQKFKKNGYSTFYIFNHAQSELILSGKYTNRDFSENGKEVFPNDMTDEDNNDEEPAYTMTLSALFLRFYRNQKKIVSKHNVVRVDENDIMFGQSTDFWEKHKSKFDAKDFR